METIMEVLAAVGGILLFSGLEIVAIVMLIAAAIYSRKLVVVIVMGVLAAGCMAIEWIILWALADLNRSDPTFGITLKIVSAISILCLLIYFPLAIRRCKAYRQRLATAPPLPAAP